VLYEESSTSHFFAFVSIPDVIVLEKSDSLVMFTTSLPRSLSYHCLRVRRTTWLIREEVIIDKGTSTTFFDETLG